MTIRKIISSVFLLVVFSSCSQKVPAQNSNEKMQQNLWKPISLKSWKETPAINNRVANEEDVNKGNAVYFIEEKSELHKYYKISLPKLAYLTDFETKKKSLVVIIQMEEFPEKGIVVGYRNLDGGNGAGLINEFQILDEVESEKLIK